MVQLFAVVILLIAIAAEQTPEALCGPSYVCCHSCPHNLAVHAQIVPLRPDGRVRQAELQANDRGPPSMILGRDPPIPRPLT